jgi:hypothetical protein
MKRTKKKEPCLIYQSDAGKIYWDIGIAILLIFVCLVIPYNLVFMEKQGREWDLVYYITDFIFFIDIIVAFCTTLPDESSFNEITKRSTIAYRYLAGWFWIDFLSIVPFDDLLTLAMNSGSTNNVNNLVRMSKMGKITKIIRLIRLVKVVKIFKNKERLTAQFSKSL